MTLSTKRKFVLTASHKHQFLTFVCLHCRFNQDFGPLNLGMVYLYCRKVNSILKVRQCLFVFKMTKSPLQIAEEKYHNSPQQYCTRETG